MMDKMDDLARVDPAIYAVIERERQRQLRQAGDDRLGELRQQRRAPGPGLHPDPQVRRGLPGAPLLRRLRVRGHRRRPGLEPGEGAFRRGLRQRPAPFRQPGQYGRLFFLPETRGHHPGHGPGPRRPSEPRGRGEFLRAPVSGGNLRGGPANRRSRLRRGDGKPP